VLDSGCTQHINENGRMFTSNDNEDSEYDKIILLEILAKAK
jgi:hypothetical protein